MKRTVLRFLVCPTCKADLELKVTEERGAEIVTGSLSCRQCRIDYPILRGVPRLVASGDYASSFGYQWNRFRKVQLDSLNGTRESEATLDRTTGWTSKDYAGRLVLDAGVGAGRFAEVVAKHGGEIVGIDLTNAVDAAYLTIGEHENVHIIQADILAMPFRPETFDLAYSVGVLHHTSDTRAAFDRVAAVVKKGGGFAVYLYPGYGLEKHFSDAIRKVTTRLPLKMMFGMSAVAVPLYYVYRIPILGKLLQIVGPISMHPDWRWRWLDTFDWYTPRYQGKYLYPEVLRWYRENSFNDVVVFDDPIRMRGMKTG
jgi:SAM-dependent methyltransferase